MSAKFYGALLAALLTFSAGALAQSTAVKPPFSLDQLTTQPSHTSPCVPGGSTAVLQACTLSTMLDFIGATRGGLLYRGVSAWSYLAPGTSGQYLQTQGGGADPLWATVSGGSSGLSGLTAGQLGIAGSSTTISSSVPTGTTGNSTVVQTTSGGLLTPSILPLATPTAFGAVKVDGITINAAAGVISTQMVVKTVASSCTIGTNCDSTNDTGGELLIPTAASITITAPNPGGITGKSYNFGSNGVVPFAVTTVGGAATFYGCTGSTFGATTTIQVPVDEDLSIISDGTNYKCTLFSTHTQAIPVTIVAGVNPNNLPIVSYRQARQLVGVRCRPEVVAGNTATIHPVSAASGTLISAGTAVTSGDCNMNTGAGTNQDLTLTTTPLLIASGTTLGIQTAGAGWSGTPVAVGLFEFMVR